MKRFLPLWFSFYLAIYCLPFPLGFIPGTTPIIESYFHVLIKTADWVGVYALGLSPAEGPIVGGDTRASYISVGLFAIISLFVALAWIGLISDKSDKKDQTLRLGVYHYIRFALANYLLFYGWDKIILPGQFGELTPGRLMQSYGDSTPMELLWNFMAASTSYTIFTGALEVLAGGLLFIRRTVCLGALLSIGIMANVFMLNLSYGVQVKLFSFHLLLFSIFLVGPELSRLLQFFVLNRPTAPRKFPRLFARYSKAVAVLQTVLILTLLFSAIQSGIKAARYYQNAFAETKFFGVWDVIDFAGEDFDVSCDRWARIGFDIEDEVFVRTSHGRWLKFQMQPNFENKKFELTSSGDVGDKAQLEFFQPSSEEMTLSGKINSRDISIRLKKDLSSKFRLQENGFEWVR